MDHEILLNPCLSSQPIFNNNKKLIRKKSFPGTSGFNHNHSHNVPFCYSSFHNEVGVGTSLSSIEMVVKRSNYKDAGGEGFVGVGDLSSSPGFHSATEDPDEEEEGYDRSPLLFNKGPPRPVSRFPFLLNRSERKYHPQQEFSNDKITNLAAYEEPEMEGEDDDYEDDDEESYDDEGLEDYTNTGRNTSTKETKCSIGILLAATSCIFFATSALIVKISSLHPMELLCVRGLLQAVFISPILISSGNSFLGPRGSRPLLLARAVLGAVSLIMSFASIHLIPLADAATCIFTSPVFVSLFACICLGEVCGWFDVTMITLTLVGVILVSQPSLNFNILRTGSWSSVVGTICGLSAAMLTALAFIVLRQLKHVHYSVTVFWFSVILAMFGAVLTVALDGFKVPSGWQDTLDCVGIGLCGFLGQILLTKALQLENAGPCSVARTLDIVLAFFYQITLLHDTPDWYSYLGSFLVVSCVLLTAFRKWHREKYEKGTTGINNGANNNDIGGAPRKSSTTTTTSSQPSVRTCNYSRANRNMS